jgi:hypothetical protein
MEALSTRSQSPEIFGSTIDAISMCPSRLCHFPESAKSEIFLSLVFYCCRSQID